MKISSRKISLRFAYHKEVTVDTKKYISLIFEAAVTKRLKRTGWQILGDNWESIGEHTFLTSVIAYFLAKTLKSDLTKVLTMSLFHDFHESRIGDADKIALDYITRDIAKANRDIFSAAAPELKEMLDEYEAKKSTEARIVYESNILALLVEVKRLVENGNTNAAEWLEANASRVKLPEARELAQGIMSGNTQDWWASIRDRLRDGFRRE
ncbi:hypothetical protein A2Z33_07450 [Candidatus Gottesmanbacteria bacterium RBG_16_52_11]|uniref:HD domain-containing protein n=1 Tax=Candidatus Gottesmanbacteria bacterium RBG_16_52_11 TaxID=1798374 RepID=A0A1F5YP14_9BACT|nr:MAG: hypothetical protein A2Z33_07450 [Candidatus Gottesmanbacteria bacterium RBG_16_52_11]